MTLCIGEKNPKLPRGAYPSPTNCTTHAHKRIEVGLYSVNHNHNPISQLKEPSAVHVLCHYVIT